MGGDVPKGCAPLASKSASPLPIASVHLSPTTAFGPESHLTARSAEPVSRLSHFYSPHHRSPSAAVPRGKRLLLVLNSGCGG